MDGTSDEELSDGVRQCLESLQSTMQGCQRACDEFAQELPDTKDSNFISKLRFQFKEKKIMAFKYRIGSYKSTLSIALQLATL